MSRNLAVCRPVNPRDLLSAFLAWSFTRGQQQWLHNVSCTSRTPRCDLWTRSLSTSIRRIPARASIHHDVGAVRVTLSLSTNDNIGTSNLNPRGHRQSSTRTRNKNVYILGSGSVGKFIAHALISDPNPAPVTLLLHKPSLINEWHEAKQSISVVRHGIADSRSNFNVELALPTVPDGLLPRNHDVLQSNREYLSDEPIQYLVVCLKAYQNVSALNSIRHRLRPESTILFLQNGMGMMEEVNERVFRDPATRPNYMLGILSHGVHSKGAFRVVHAGQGTISLGLVPKVSFQDQNKDGIAMPWAASAQELLRIMTRIPILAAVALSPTDLAQVQLEKLSVNCIINPLTVILDNRNGSILSAFQLSRVMRLLLAEISLVIRSLPELEGIPNIEKRFDPARLESLVKNVATKTAENISSMLQDVRRGSQTEIEYINGYIVKRGEELGIPPVLNYMLTQLVLGKQSMIKREVDEYTPFDLKHT